MPIVEERQNWGDLFLGLHLAAQTCEHVGTVSVGRAMLVQEMQRVSLGQTTIWTYISDACQAAIWWLKPWQSLPHIWNVVVVPIFEWLSRQVLWPALDWAVAWLKNTWDWFGLLYDFALTWLTGRISSYETRFDTTRNILWVKLFGMENLRWSNWGDVLAYWWHSFVAMLASVRDRIQAIPAAIIAQFTAARTWGQERVDQLATWWKVGAVPWLYNFWQSILALPERMRLAFLGWWEEARSWPGDLRTWWNLTAWPFILHLPEWLYDLARTWLLTGYNVFVSWWDAWTEGIIDDAKSAIERATPVVRSWVAGFESLPSTFLNWVAETAGTDLGLNPSRALATAGSLYSMSIAAGTTAHVLATTLNAIPATNWVGASQLAGFVAQAAGFDRLTDATYGVLIDEALTWPLRYHWNQMLRPKIPTEGAIFIMGRKRGLNRGEFSQAMAYQGLPDWWIDREYQFFWTDPSPYWLLRMSEHATPKLQPSDIFLPWLEEWLPDWRSDPWAWFRMKLMLAGFEDTDIPAFIAGFQSRRLGPAVTQIKTSVRAMVREAYWGRAEAQNALRPLGVRQEEIEYILLAENIDYQNVFNDNQVRYYNESFRKGELSLQDLSLMLSTFIVRPERVAQIVARERVRAMPKAAPIVPGKVDPLITTLIRQAMNSWTKAWRAYEIEGAELLLGLTIVVQDDVLARQLVEVELTRYRPPPPEPLPPPEDPLVRKVRLEAISFWIKQFRDGEISADMLELGLANLIDDPEIVRLVSQIEELRARRAVEILPLFEEDPAMAAVREETVRGHLEMFRKRLIGLDELYLYLVQDGLAQLLAQATVLTQALKRVRTLPPDSPYFMRDAVREVIDEAIVTYGDMVRRGEISIEELKVNLAGAGVDPDLAMYLADTLEVQIFAEKWGL